MTALAIALSLIAGMILADIAQTIAWRRFVAKQRERTARIGGEG